LGGALPARNVSGEARRVCEVAQTVTAAGQNAPLRFTLALPVNVSFPGAPKIAAAGAFHFAVSLRGLPQALDALAREP
jgi:hypothetical protein